jgi:hypothetical protein
MKGTEEVFGSGRQQLEFNKRKGKTQQIHHDDPSPDAPGHEIMGEGHFSSNNNNSIPYLE